MSVRVSMKAQTSKTVIWVAGLIMLITAAPSIFAGPYVDYDVSKLMGNVQAARQFNQRFGFSSSLYRDDLLVSPLLELQQDIDTVSLLSDWHPGHGLFRLSAGVLYQTKEGKQMHIKQPYQISFQVPNIDTGFSGLSTDGASPYLGFGWGNNHWQGSKLGFNVDMGVLYQPDESLLDNQAVASFNENSSDKNIRHKLKELELEPVFSLGLSYNF